MNWTQRLFQQLHQDDDQENRRRADKSCICSLCLEPYWKHPYFDEHTFYGHPMDHRLCNGDIVHL